MDRRHLAGKSSYMPVVRNIGAMRRCRQDAGGPRSRPGAFGNFAHCTQNLTHLQRCGSVKKSWSQPVPNRIAAPVMRSKPRPSPSRGIGAGILYGPSGHFFASRATRKSERVDLRHTLNTASRHSRGPSANPEDRQRIHAKTDSYWTLDEQQVSRRWQASILLRL